MKLNQVQGIVLCPVSAPSAPGTGETRQKKHRPFIWVSEAHHNFVKGEKTSTALMEVYFTGFHNYAV